MTPLLFTATVALAIPLLCGAVLPAHGASARRGGADDLRISFAFASGQPGQPAAGPAEIAARQLVPILRDVRRRLDPQLGVRPGTLPPSPFTGRNSTLFAVTIGVRSMEVDEAVLKALDRLLAWDPDEPLAPRDRELVAAWLDELQVRVLSRMAAGGQGMRCEDPCVVQHLTRPGTMFGATPREQVETRDAIMLDALAAVATTSQR
jgi:hypothetical protein